MTEEELIAFAKPYLKERGYLKKRKRWIKREEEFTVHFYLQGSFFDKDDYYIRPGVFINALLPSELTYGHFMTGIKQGTPEQVMRDFEEFREKWTNKEYIKKTLLDFVAWEERNPLEMRRANLCDCEKDPVPSDVCFMIGIEAKEYILEHF